MIDITTLHSALDFSYHSESPSTEGSHIGMRAAPECNATCERTQFYPRTKERHWCPERPKPLHELPP